jgi:rhodanese-related sulfurtransferase
MLLEMSRLKEINAKELFSMIQDKHHLELVDIRTPAEVKRGVIPNAKTLPMHLIPLNIDYFSLSQNQIVIYCRTGSRSAQACRFLNEQGINNVINLRGGITKWSSGGLHLDPAPLDIIA